MLFRGAFKGLHRLAGEFPWDFPRVSPAFYGVEWGIRRYPLSLKGLYSLSSELHKISETFQRVSERL